MSTRKGRQTGAERDPAIFFKPELRLATIRVRFPRTAKNSSKTGITVNIINLHIVNSNLQFSFVNHDVKLYFNDNKETESQYVTKDI
jgi:hypothetical protein